MKYIVDENIFETVDETLDYIFDNLTDQYYDEMLDECYEEIDICGYKYSPSVALYRVDPVAYRCGRNDYYDSLSRDFRYDLETMWDGEILHVLEFEVESKDNEEDDG